MYIDTGRMTAEELAELAQAVEVEQGKRKAAESASESSYRGWSTTTRSSAPCPHCGRDDDAIQAKTLYGTPELARGGDPIGTLVYCRCGGHFNSRTGEPVPGSKAFTY